MKRLPKSEAKPAPKHAWMVSDILGFEVFDAGGNKLGFLCEVISTASNDVWVVKYGAKETLIPALKNVVLEVNAGDKKIIVRLPEGHEEVFGGGKEKPEGAEYDGYRVYED